MIQPSISPYSAPVTLVSKKDEGEKSRLVVDFRALNKITIVDSYPFPRIEDIIDKLHGSKIFTTLDISSGFWYVQMKSENVHKTAFSTQSGHHEFLVCPFGFRNSPAIFQRAIFRILEKNKLTKFAHNYLDDIMVHSRNFEEHLTHLRAVFQAMRREEVKFKLSKCHIAEQRVTYLGHDISENEIRPTKDHIIAIQNFPIPRNKKSLQQLLGKINFNRKFIPNASKNLNPLYELLKINKNFEWTDDCQKAFDQIKHILTTEPVLKIFNPQKSCSLLTDASKIGIGAVLKQESDEDKQLHPVAYFSKKLLSYQQNYSISELECLAIVESLEYFHHYLYGTKFIVITDHQALKYLHKMKKPNSRLFKWALKLSQYDFTIE